MFVYVCVAKELELTAHFFLTACSLFCFLVSSLPDLFVLDSSLIVQLLRLWPEK